VGPVAVAARYAVRDPGAEVSGTQLAGESRGPRGRWAVLLRRPRNPLPSRDKGAADASATEPGDAQESSAGGETKATPSEASTRHTIEGD
jgi:hypothetical protein